MERMLSHFLDFARQQDLTPGAVNLREVVDESVVAVNELVQEKRISLRTSISSSLPLFRGDGPLIRQALQNLLLNSCQAVRIGGRIRLLAYPLLAKEKLVKIVCLDDGPGIPEAMKVKIFHPFFTTREKGTGLGLPFVKKVTLLHGGTIELKSRPNNFTAFVIRLPMREIEVEEPVPPLVFQTQQRAGWGA